MFTRHVFGVTSLIALTAAMPASAAITPEQAWQMWRDLAEGVGYVVTTGGERRDGDRLIVDKVDISYGIDKSSVRIPLGEIVFRDQGDGSVAVTIPENFDISARIEEPDAEPVEMKMNLSHEGYVTVVSGTPEAPVFDITADSLSLAQDAPVVGGKTVPMELYVGLGGLTGRVTLTGSEALRDISYTLDAEDLEFNLSAADPETGADMAMEGSAAGLKSAFTGRLPGAITPGAQLSEILASGLRGEGTQETGPVAFSIASNSEEQDMTAEGTLSGTALTFRLGDTGINYSVTGSGIDVTAEGSQIPFPDFRITASEYTVGFGMPLVVTPEPVDFSLLLRVAELTLPDAVWGMLDPTAKLSRAPATLIVDAVGKARMLRDPTAPPAGDAEEDDMPGELHGLTIRALQLKAAGADLTGTGDFTFDNDDTTTFPGFPRPTGKAELKLTGGNTLLDNLVALGLVPQDQMMGVRMMMALFTRPGEGPDTLTSTLEVSPEGNILANGQRIQ